MTLTTDELERRKQLFRKRQEAFSALGHDGGRAAALVLDALGPLEGPVLDLGSGMGVMARELARRGLTVESVDVSAEDQEVAASLTLGTGLESRVHFTPADGAALPFPDRAFATAVSFNVLHHLTDGASVLREMVRVLRPGGVLVLVEFSPEGFEFAGRVLSAEGGVHPEGPVTLDWARGFLAGLGLSETAGAELHHERFAALRSADSSTHPTAPGERLGTNEGGQGRARRALAISAAVAAAATAMLALDLTWLGFLAAGLYDSMIGPLKRPVVMWPAAALFYALYISAVVVYAVLGSSSLASALRRGAALGLVAYGTYELTNWAVIRDWPALLVPIDIAWGMVLTAAVGLVGKLVHTSVMGWKG